MTDDNGNEDGSGKAPGNAAEARQGWLSPAAPGLPLSTGPLRQPERPAQGLEEQAGAHP